MEVRLAFDRTDMSVAKIGVPEMRREEMPQGDRLSAVAVPISAGFYLIGLQRGDKDVQYNLDLMRTRGWFDLPMQLADGRIAKVTIEKGASGERAFNDAAQGW